MTTETRTRIGRFNDIATRQIVYQTGEALEIDEIDQFEVVRRRVYWDDILLVTFHTMVGMAFVITMAVFFVLFLAIAGILQSSHENDAAMWFAGLSAPFLLALFTRVLFKRDVITVYGRRSKASMRFTFRKTYARDKFAEICDLARTTQARIAAEKAAMEPAPPSPMAGVPMPPAEGPGTAEAESAPAAPAPPASEPDPKAERLEG